MHSTFLYAGESWTLTAELQRRIQAMEMRCYRKILRISYKDHATNEEVRAKIQQAIGPHEDLLTIVTRRNLQWYGRASSSSGLAKTILRGTVKGGRRQGRQRKRWDDNIGKWKGLEFGKSQKAVENREKMEKTGCKIICGAPTTLAVKGLMMMMMTTHLLQRSCYQRGRPGQDAARNRTIRRLPGHYKEKQTAVVWPCLPSIRSGQNHLARHSERGKKTRQTEEEVGRQHKGMDRPGVR